MGGCPYDTLRKNLKKPAACSGWKNNLKEMLLLYYQSYLQQKAKKNVNIFFIITEMNSNEPSKNMILMLL